MVRGLRKRSLLQKAPGFSSLLLLTIVLAVPAFAGSHAYPWLKGYDAQHSIAVRVAPPEGYVRVSAKRDSFAYWLRHLPLKQGRPRVLLYSGKRKLHQFAHHAVVDIDVGDKDLQQCADAVMRLRAEYLYSQERYGDIYFNFTSGHRAAFSQWSEGYRPHVKGKASVVWVMRAKKDRSRASFREYLDSVQTYAGSYSLSKEMQPVRDVTGIRIGDVFIQGGFPGHAVIVVDIVVHKTRGDKLVLLAQSYTPAQDIHILKNPLHPMLTPWYRVRPGKKLVTPEWVFPKDSLRQFK